MALEILEDRLAPATLTVNTNVDVVNPTDGTLSLRDAILAIDAGNANGLTTGEMNQVSDTFGNDTIQFCASLTGQTITLGSALPALSRNAAIIGPGADQLAVSGALQYQVFDINGGVTASISGMTIENGSTGGYDGTADASDAGGGIYNGGTLTVSNCTFSGNMGFVGGAVEDAGVMHVTGSTFINNSATVNSGAIDCNYYSDYLTVTDCIFTDNNAAWGGAINNGGTMTVAESTFSGNTATIGGGAIDTNVYTLSILDCTLNNNSAPNGGAIFNNLGGTLGVIDSTIAGNSATGSGGGIDTTGPLTLVNSTLSGNTAASGGGIYSNSYYGAVTLNNTIVANSSSGGDLAGFGFAGANDLIDDGSYMGSFTNSLQADPLLGPLGDYGGPTETMALLPGSPAIDAGSNALAVDPQGHAITTDQRGYARIVGAAIDIGAVEFRSAPATSTSVTASVNRSVYGSNVTFTATVSTVASGVGTPTGTVQFQVDGEDFDNPQPLNANGTACLTTSALPVGGHSITAVYSGDTDFLGSTGELSRFITTVAGDGTQGYGGDGGPAIVAQLAGPTGVAVDAAGDLFIADQANNVIREVSPAGIIITTVAGNGSAGYSGDGGPATAAQLNNPFGVALDAAGDLFITDSGNNVVRKVSAIDGMITSASIITTVAGNGTPGYSGDGGPATAAQLFDPSGVAVDAAGDLFIADNSNSVVREVQAGTGIITTVAGTGTPGYSGDDGPATTAQLSFPSGVAVDAAGDLFIADTGNSVVREVQAGTGIITTVAGTGTAGYSGDDGLATAAQLSFPAGVAVDAAGDLFIADTGNSVLREVQADTGIITTIAGTGTEGYSGDGPSTTAQLSYPAGVAVDAVGDLFIADADNNLVREVTPQVVTRATPIITWATPSTITYGTALSGTQLDGTANVAGSFAYTPAAGTILDAGTQTLSVVFTPTDALDYFSTTDSVSLTVNPASTTTALSANVNPSVLYQPVVFTATVAANTPGSGTPSGQVDFVDTTTGTDLGSVSLSDGQASLTTSALPAGNQVIVASYSGASNFATSTGTLTQQVSATPLLENGVLAIPGTASAATITLTPVLPTGASAYSMKVSYTFGANMTKYGPFAASTIEVYGGPDTDAVTLSGTAASDAFTVGNGTVSEIAAQTTTFTVGLIAVTTTTLDGAAGSDSLTGLNQVNAWAITGKNTGTLNGSIAFEKIENLTGGSVADTFAFVNGGSITGNLTGVASMNTVDDSGYGRPLTVNLQTTKATGIGGTWANIQNFIGTATTDTLVAGNTTNTWSITGTNAGTVGAVSFAGLPDLTGGSANDTFAFLPGGSITGNLSGAAPINTLDYSAYGSAATVNLATKTASGVGGTWTNVEDFIGTGTTDTLTGPNANSTWSITAGNTGTVGAYSFEGFPNLTGGSGNNTFAFSAGASVSGTLTGGGGTNTLDYSAYATPVTVNLQTTTATGIAGTWANIQSFKGTNTTDTFIATDGTTNSWALKGSNAGTVDGVAFTGFANLTGGSGNDTFTFANNATVSGVVDGKGGANTLDYSAYTGGITVNLGNATTGLANNSATGVNGVITNGIANIGNVVAGSGNNYLTAVGVTTGVTFTATGNGNNILVGGSGSNTLTASGSGNNIVIGGQGTSTINGGTGYNLLIGGYTAYDAVYADLEAIMSIWKTVSSAKTYAKAITNLTAASYAYSLTAATVHGNANDTINAGTHLLDWYFAASASEITGENAGETVSLC